ETRTSSWRRQRLNDAGYALGWRVYDYAGHRVVFHAGAVQGYRGAMAVMPERDLGVVLLWNGESSLPTGLVPTILDSAIGLTPQAWLDVDLEEIDVMLAKADRRPAPTIQWASGEPSGGAGGSGASTAGPEYPRGPDARRHPRLGCGSGDGSTWCGMLAAAASVPRRPGVQALWPGAARASPPPSWRSSSRPSAWPTWSA